MSRQLNIIFLLVAAFAGSIVIGIIYSPFLTDDASETDDVPNVGDVPEIDEEQPGISWLDVELTDISTGSTFMISDFVGKPILLESFAVWCTTCLQQQRILDDLLEQEGDAIIHISLNTDPNEDESRVQDHIEKYGFSWYFAVAPIELTNELRDQFGLGVFNAPSAPVVLVCEDQSARFLRSGIKSVDDLLSEIDTGC